MTGKMLSKVGASLVRRFGTRDPFQIAKELGISVLLCEDFGSLKGMYRVVKRNRFIFLNKDLGDRMLRIVCAHEFMLYDMTTRPEYEANIVAAEILIDNEELLDYIYTYRYSAEQIARAMDTDINLVALKIAHLAELGYDLRPVNHRSDFLR